MRHIHLTTHFQKFRCILQLFGNAADGADIGGHILTHHAIAAGRGTNQFTVFIFQTAGKAIDLDFHHILRLYAGFPHAAVKIPQFIIRKCIQQAFHFYRMGHLGQLAAGRAAYLLGRRRCRDQLRKLCFQFFQFPGQSIILKIFKLRGILVIVKPIVFLDHSAQFFHALFCLFQLQKFHSPAIRFLPRCRLALPPENAPQKTILIISHPAALCKEKADTICISALNSACVIVFNHCCRLI